MCVLMSISLFRCSQKRGFKSAPEPSDGFGNYEKNC